MSQDDKVIRNKLRGVNQTHIQTTPEYERLNIKPTAIGAPPVQRKVNAQRSIPTAPRPVRGQRIAMPPQAKVAVGVNEDEMWVDERKVEDPNQEEFIDNNEFVDTESLQKIKVNLKNPVEEDFKDDGEYIVLLHGKTISDTISLASAEELIESVFFSDDGKDIGPEDFTVFKKVVVKIGVHIRG